MKLAAIVLAAGKSSRMGTNKLLLAVGDKRVLDHILSKLRPIPTIVVFGHRPEDIKELAESLGAKTIHNPNHEHGMTTSFQAGLRALGPNVDAVFMVLSDTFGFKHGLLDRMVEKMKAEPDAQIVSPVHEGKRGHPVLISMSLFEEFLALGKDGIMKSVINRHERHHRYVEGDIWCVLDMDTPEDYEKVKKRWETTRVSAG
ncbi:MAG: nucleotidyltransferase family protein [Candidatus Bathyarchaeota archaeon]|nr:nucleotidyltransferase family protein [Candidatus Bathyarchaeota archaeon]